MNNLKFSTSARTRSKHVKHVDNIFELPRPGHVFPLFNMIIFLLKRKKHCDGENVSYFELDPPPLSGQ